MTTLTAVGDVFLTAPLARDDGYQAVCRTLAEGDVVFANLEQCLTRRQPPAYPTEKVIVLWGDPAIAREVKALGVQVVSLANNHMLDWGYHGLLETLAAVGEAGLSYAGAGQDLAEARQFKVMHGGNLRFAFIAFSSQLPRGSAASPHRPGINPLHVETHVVLMPSLLSESPAMTPPLATYPLDDDVEALVQSVKEARKAADVVVVSSHGGAFGPEGVAEYQIAVAHALVDAGADVFLGHNSHRLQGIEVYRGRPIFYDLGNFIFHPMPATYANPHLTYGKKYTVQVSYSRMSRDTVIARLTLSGGKLAECEVIPIRGNSQGEPRLAPPEAAAAIVDHLQEISRPWGTRISLRQGRGQVHLQ